MFIGPFENTVPWSTDGLVGTRRFLEKIWRQQEKIQYTPNEKLNVVLHKTIKKISTDIEAFKFNTAVSQMMILANELDKEQTIGNEQYAIVLQLLAPFAPHVAEELWQRVFAADKKSIHTSTWPVYDESQAMESEMTLAVQVNGKTRSMMVVSAQTSEDDIKKLAQEDEKVKKYLTGEPKKIIYVPGRLVSIVV
jgi:leucyl-tRNA synthetase